MADISHTAPGPVNLWDEVTLTQAEMSAVCQALIVAVPWLEHEIGRAHV